MNLSVRLWRTLLHPVAFVTVLLVAVGVAAAQQPAPKAFKEERFANPGGALRPVNLQTGNVTDFKAFEDYYKWYLCRLTWPERQRELTDLRSDIRRELRTINRGNKQAYEMLGKLTLETMTRYALDEEYSPASRINAMLVANSIDDVNGKPHPQSVPLMLKSFGGSLKPNAPNDALRVVALVGLLRVAESNPDADTKKQIASGLATIVAQKAVPEGRSEDAHAWIRRRSADVLGALGLVETTRGGGEVIKVLTAVVGEKTAPLAVRTDAARALSGLQFAQANPANMAPVCHALAGLSVDVARANEPLEVKQQMAGAILAALDGNGGDGVVKAASGSGKDYVVDGSSRIRALIDPIAKTGSVQDALTSDVEQWYKANPPKDANLAAVGG